MRPVKRDDWNRTDLPRLRTTLQLDRLFSAEEVELLRAGLLPVQMEDKWFVYWEKDVLHFHRSWTGICIYVIQLREEPGGWRMHQAEVNRDPEDYSETDDERDVELISYLIDTLLLQRPADYPANDPKQAPLEEWTSVGRAALGQRGTPGINAVAIDPETGEPIEREP